MIGLHLPGRYELIIDVGMALFQFLFDNHIVSLVVLPFITDKYEILNIGSHSANQVYNILNIEIKKEESEIVRLRHICNRGSCSQLNRLLLEIKFLRADVIFFST